MKELKLEKQAISSREVAEMMETRHDNLMSKIEKHTKILEKVTDLKIKVSDLWQLSSYKDKTGRSLKEYLVTKKGCEFLAHKTTGEKGDIFTIRYMNKFEEMEQYIKTQTLPSYMIEDPIARAERWIKEQKEKQELQEQNELMQPKADYFDNLVERNLLLNFRDSAKELHIKERKFINWLLENKYVYRDNKNKLKPYSKYVEDGLFEIKEFGNAKFAGIQTLITPKGRETFRLLYND